MGYIYDQEAKQHMDTFLGLRKFFSEVKEKVHILKSGFSTLMSAMEMQKFMEEAERNGSMQNEAMQRELAEKGIAIMWKFGILEIEFTVRQVCEIALNIPDKVKRNEKARVVKKMGELFLKYGKNSKGPNLKDFGFEEKNPNSKPIHTHETPLSTSSTEPESKPPSQSSTSNSTSSTFKNETSNSNSSFVPPFRSSSKIYQREALNEMPIKQLRDILGSRGIDSSTFFEKSDMINAIMESQ